MGIGYKGTNTKHSPVKRGEIRERLLILRSSQVGAKIQGLHHIVVGKCFQNQYPAPRDMQKLEGAGAYSKEQDDRNCSFTLSKAFAFWLVKLTILAISAFSIKN